MTAAADRDPHDRRLSLSAAGVLADLNRAGLLDAADVHVARRLGFLGGERDDDVLLAAALAVRGVRGGSVCVDLAALDDIESSRPWPPGARWREAIAGSPLHAAGVLRLEGDLLYLARYWEEESQVVEDLRRRDAEAPVVDGGALDAALRRYFPDAGEQREAARLACERWTAVVTGGPGTGKTTTIARLLGVLFTLAGDAPLRVALAAPTGKAAARMTQALHEATQRPEFPDADHGARAVRERISTLEASTLHRLLGWRRDSSTRFRHDRSNRLPHDVVVVDETSMVSLTLMARLLEAMRPEARLVLVGDADQLASVEAGAVLGDIVRGWPEGPVTTLRTVHRFGRNIRELADAVREGDADQVCDLLAAGRVAAPGSEDGTVTWTPAPDEPLDERLRDHARAVHDAARDGAVDLALAAYERHRLLCAHREGPYGVGHWNRRVERLLMQSTGREWLDEWYVGRPFLVDRNDQGLRLWNGDTGITCRRPSTDCPDGTDGKTRLVGVVGDSTSTPRELVPARLAEVSTAHAMTVHRSQGSQFGEVTVLLPDQDSRILTRELLYTAITRARSTVHVVGDLDSVRAAVQRPARRATGLSSRLRG